MEGKSLIIAAAAGAATSYFKLDRTIPLPSIVLHALAGVAANYATDDTNHRGEFLPFGQMFAAVAGAAGGFAIVTFASTR